ncbi:hypothetical protein CRENBAI_020961 [Crenichthys baileyi]|uniref:Uncharacterized protein n=1 Tax=Crenichthys baileyi TaxID=28760 RepID=A0AAV9RII3_9TELE
MDEGFEEEAPSDPVSGEFKEQLDLVLVSEGSPHSVPVSGGPVSSVPVSEGSPDSTPDYEPPGSQPDYEAPGSKPPEFHRVSGGPSTLHGRPPDLPHRGSSTLLGRPPDQPAGSRRRPPGSLRLCRSPGLRRHRRLINPLSRGSWTPHELCGCSGRPPGRPPNLCACSGRPPGRPPELCACSGRPPGRPPELCFCFCFTCAAGLDERSTDED